MSTLSSERLPAVSLDKFLKVSMYEDYIIRTIGTGANTSIELTVDVISYNLVDKEATLTLWRSADLVGKKLPPQSSSLASETFVLDDGYQPHTFTLPIINHPDLVGPQGQLVRLTLSCPTMKYLWFSKPFKLEQANKCGFDVKLQLVFSTRSKELPYPQSNGHLGFMPENFRGWSALFQSGQAQYEERIIISALARVEAALDGVQSWDSEVVTAGFFQKTLNTKGAGQLPPQLYKFKQDEPTRWACLMGSINAGWDVTRNNSGAYRVTYTDPKDNNTTYGIGNQYDKDLKALRLKIHEIHTSQPKSPNDLYTNRILDHFVRLGRDESYQRRQILDALDRLHTILAQNPFKVDRSDQTKPFPSNKLLDQYKIGDYFRSIVGRAYVLNEYCNREQHPPFYVGLALDLFRKLKWGQGKLPTEPNADPRRWPDPDAHGTPSIYEQELIKIFAVSIHDQIYVLKDHEVESQNGTRDRRYNEMLDFFEDNTRLDVSWMPKIPREVWNRKDQLEREKNQP